MQKIIVEHNDDNKRIDTYLIEKLNISRNQIQKLINDKNILVNDKSVKNSYILKNGDVIIIKRIKDNKIKVCAEKLDLNVIYEDDCIIIINKHKDLVMHPAVGNESGTLVNALLYHFDNLSDINGKLRPGIIHRLDSQTTGLVVVAKDNESHKFIAKQLKDKTMVRKYYALVWGIINNQTGTIDAPIGRDLNNRKKLTVTSHNSKDAITHFKVIKRFEKTTLVEVSLETGRTHQIRVHFQYIKHPVVNDPLYGRKKTIDETGQCLHAKTIGFIHPSTNEYMEFTSDLPSEFIKVMNLVNKQ